MNIYLILVQLAWALHSTTAAKRLITALDTSLAANESSISAAIDDVDIRKRNNFDASSSPSNVINGDNSTSNVKNDEFNAPNVADRRPNSTALCGNADTFGSFVRYDRTAAKGTPTLVKTMDLPECVQHCADDSDSWESEAAACQGFNYQDYSTPTCEYFDAKVETRPFNQNVGQRAFYFEKVCFSNLPESCINRTHAFESVSNAQLKDNVLKQMVVDDELSCLEVCLGERSFICQSVNYVASSKLCELSRFSRRSRPHDFRRNVNGVSYFENNCLTRHTRCSTGGQVYFTKNIDSELQRVDNSAENADDSLDLCLQKCLNSASTFCRSVEFDLFGNECFISEDDSYSAPEILTLASSLAVDLYEPICLPKTERKIDCKRPYLFERFFNSALNTVTSFRTLISSILEDCLMLCLNNEKCRSLNYDRKSRICWLFDDDHHNSSNQLIVAHDIDYYENNCPKSYRNISNNTLLQVPAQQITSSRPLVGRTFNTPQTTVHLNDTEEYTDEYVNKYQTAPLDARKVSVSAVCTQDGVNVTISSSQTYNGAIYAAERFSYCRNLVFDQTSFWLFLPNPMNNTACNTVFVNNLLTGVVVVSNDNVIPYDITTKDDLFYQITCDYNHLGEKSGKVLVTSGVVVSGPSPKITSAVGTGKLEASLKILRNEQPVDSVLIGEQLTLNIETTSSSISRVTAMSCNVTRVGGTDPPPEPLTIVDHGCPEIPQIIGPFQRIRNKLTANMTAFRIDGSAEIQVSCLIMFCPDSCLPSRCNGTEGEGEQLSYGRRRRSAKHEEGTSKLNKHLVETVNGKLRVYVEGEEAATQLMEERFAQSAKCVQRSTFIVVTLLLSVILLSVAIGMMVVVQRNHTLSNRNRNSRMSSDCSGSSHSSKQSKHPLYNN